jgi:hypothetical protein
VQSWFPFSVDVCIDGRQWLARQMDQAGIAYRQRDNCFTSDLQKLYPKFLRHAMSSFQSPDALRFLGRKVPLSGKVHGGLEATSQFSAAAAAPRSTHPSHPERQLAQDVRQRRQRSTSRNHHRPTQAV